MSVRNFLLVHQLFVILFYSLALWKIVTYHGKIMEFFVWSLYEPCNKHTRYVFKILYYLENVMHTLSLLGNTTVW